MRILAFVACSAALLGQLAPPIADYPIRPVPIQDVRVTGGFWTGRLAANRTVTIPLLLRENERAVRRDRGTNGSRAYRIIEAASLSLLSQPDRDLLKKVDALISIAAQGAGDDLLQGAGPLFEAAVAHYQATGERTLLDVARRVGDRMAAAVGPAAARDVPGRHDAVPGLVKLFRTTGDRSYLDLANSLVDGRTDLPSAQTTVAASHLVSGITDLAVMLRDPAYESAVDTSWEELASKRTSLMGAPAGDGALANQTGADACAAAASTLWSHRMFMKSGETKYPDLLEQTFYNAVLAGVSIKGDSFFSQVPLASNGDSVRSRDAGAACDPADLARVVAQWPGLIYATRIGPAGPEIFVNQYVESDAVVRLDAATVRINQSTAYPWDGRVAFRVRSDRPVTFTLKLRVPAWVGTQPFASDLYSFTAGDPSPTSYGSGDARVSTTRPGWVELRMPMAPSDGDRAAVTAGITFPMPVRHVAADARVPDAGRKAALQRGPLVYAFEAADNGGRVFDLRMSGDLAFTPSTRPDLLGGVTVLTGAGTRAGSGGVTSTAALIAVPYYAWGNRARGEMVVWVPQ